MTMTKQHFERIAAIIRKSPDKHTVKARLCEYFGEVNPRFDRDRFNTACMEYEKRIIT